MHDPSRAVNNSSTVLDHEPEVAGTDSKGPAGPRIRCPLCGWRPTKHDRWLCKCGHIWNTFDTGGVCPACIYQWTLTACLACLRFSRHSDWYED